MKKKIFALTLGLLMVAASVWAQPQAGTQSQGGIKLPPMHQETLDNGLTVIIVQHQELPVVAFRMMVKSGGMSDPSGKAGLANFAADLLRQGTKTKSATEISEEIDFVGGSLSAGADYDYLSVNCQVLKKYFDTGLNLVSDVILNPAFDKAEIERLRSRRIGEIQQSHDNPSAVASDKFREFLFGANPLANPLEGTQKSVKGITRKDIVDYHTVNFVPNNCILAVVGDVTPAEVMPKLKEKFARWQKKTLPQMTYAQPQAPKGFQLLMVDKPDLTQTYIRLGHLGVTRNNPDYFPMLVMNYILGGGGFSSRMMQEIRANRGLTYGVSCSFQMYKQGGAYAVGTFTRNDSTYATIDAVIKEIKKIRGAKVTPQELEDAKNFFAGIFPSRFETPQQIASQVLDVELYQLGNNYIQDYRKKVKEVTADDVLRVAQKYLDPENLKFVVVTNSEQVKPQVESLGDIKTVAYTE